MDSKTSRANKRKGSEYEQSLVATLRGLGYKAARLARRGSRDEGDVEVDLGDYVILIEAKNAKTMALSQWLEESKVEARNYAEARGMDESRVVPLVVVKRRMKGVDQSYAVADLATVLRLIGL
jgi:Holliday junction resolvase